MPYRPYSSAGCSSSSTVRSSGGIARPEALAHRTRRLEDHRHHRLPVLDHRLERRDVHRRVIAIPAAGVLADAPLGLAIEPELWRMRVGFADLTIVGVERGVRHAV